MFARPIRLALEVKYLDRATAFYRTHLGLSPEGGAGTDDEAILAAGPDELTLRAPGVVPRGGVHTHFAFASPADRYDDWYDDLSASFDLTEFDFGGARSLYFDDPDGHCVEIGGRGDGDEGITGIFEIVLEVEDLGRSLPFYTDLGMAVVDRGDERRRVRLQAGPLAVELWEPQLGIADARGGLHVDFGLHAENPSELAARVADRACSVKAGDDEVRIRDPDGHYLTLVEN